MESEGFKGKFNQYLIRKVSSQQAGRQGLTEVVTVMWQLAANVSCSQI